MLLSKKSAIERHLEEASEIADLGLQPRMYLRCQQVKWFHHYIQLVPLACTLPDSYDTTVYHHGWGDHPTSGINAFGVLRRHREVTPLVPQQIDVEAWQQAHDGSRYS